MQDLNHQIRERAYQLWLANGCREGEADHHWLAAEREVLSVFAASVTTAPATEQPRSRRATKDSASVTAFKAPAKRRRAS